MAFAWRSCSHPAGTAGISTLPTTNPTWHTPILSRTVPAPKASKSALYLSFTKPSGTPPNTGASRVNSSSPTATPTEVATTLISSKPGILVSSAKP
ncbi:hypothetical protein EMCG_06991 [[Emmonsia] crescens]|uniref:Uncharacterized protein n=1 Tax=[Emmonsia] crescens TaxID=73230 RepID=A0A0G2I9M2_9EURO|nr:hypothetical protein EMCG_06991 [Emmonsia crescens UAMH 3008]